MKRLAEPRATAAYRDHEVEVVARSATPEEFEQIVVKLSADSGDQVQHPLKETGPHTGVFEGQVRTGELPAGALATDMAIDHSPLMAIDRDPATFWMSEPDGAAPKALSVDMKDLKSVSRSLLRIQEPSSQVN